MVQSIIFKIQRLRLLLVAFAAWSICAHASAQDISDDEEPMRKDTIREVVVTGMRPTYNMLSPSPVQSLKGRDLERFNSQSVADAVRYFSGVQIKDYGGIGGLKTVNIRSMGSHHVGVFYDGIQLGNAQNGVIDLGKFSLDNMESIDLYNAQKSDIFQSAKDFGSAGTIYLSTIKPKFAEGEKTKLKLQYRTAFFEGIETPLIYGLTNPSVLWQQKLTDKISSTVNVEWTQSDGKYRFEEQVLQNDGKPAYDTIEIRRNSDIKAFRAEGGLNGRIENGEWSAKAYFYDSDRGIPGSVVREKSWRDQRWSDRNFFLQSSFNKSLGKRYDLKINGKYAYDYTRFVGNEPSNSVDNRYTQRELYVSAINMYRILPVWKTTLSTDFQYNTLDAEGVQYFSFPQRYTGLAALATALNLPQLKAQASILGTFVHEEVKMNTASPDKSVFTPAFFVSYKPFKREELRVRAFYKRIFRMPTFNDLYYTLIGNKNLNPEYTNQYDAGITYERLFQNSFFHKISGQADAYYNEITDKIVAIPGGQQFRWTMYNLGKTEIRGLDVATDIGCRAGETNINTRLTYTWQKAQDMTDPSNKYYGGQIPYVPKHSGSVIVSADYKTWSLNYGFIYVGERYISSANIPQDYLQPWYTSDVSFAKQFDWKSFDLKIMLEVNNLLNQYYAVIKNYPMPGRNYRLALTLNL